MAAVAICPQCHYEVEVPQGADAETWLKCLLCHASFLVRDADLREVQQPATNEDDSVQRAETGSEHDLPSGVTLELGSESLFAKQPGTADEVDTMLTGGEAAEISAEDVPPAASGLTESGEVAAKRIERWFRSADTVEDIPPIGPTSVEPSEGSLSGPNFPAMTESKNEPMLSNPLTESTANSAAPHADEIDEWTDEADSRNDRDDQSSTAQPTVPEWSAPFSDELSAADVPPDDDFVSAPADESLHRPDSSDVGTTLEFSGDTLDEATHNADFEIEELEVDRDRPTWDDPERMEQLLADVDAMPATGQEPAATQDSHEGNQDDESGIETIPPIVAAPHKRRRRKSTAVLLAGIVLGGFGGLVLGYIGLLWIASAIGQNGDVLQFARFLPAWSLPESLQTVPAQLAADAPLSEQAYPGAEEPAPLGASANESDEPAEMTASYETPASPPESTDARNIDRYATPASATQSAESESRGLADARATSLASALEFVTDAPVSTIETLAAGLEAAQRAQPGLVSGDLSDKATQRTKGLSYTKLSHLAELVTFADVQSRPEFETLRQNAELLFRETLSNPQIRNEVAYISTKWIDSPHRKMSGVFTAGAIAGHSPAGSVVELRVDLGAGSPLTVLAPPAMAERVATSAQPIGIVGSMIEKPVERIRGYTGSSPRAIWAGMLIPLE